MPRSQSPNPTRQEAGFKATLNNPNVSASAKEHARHVLEDQFGDVIEQVQVPGGEAAPTEAQPGGPGKYGSENVTTSRGEQRNKTNVVRGYKAAAHNQSNTEQGRQHARHSLEEMGVNPEE